MAFSTVITYDVASHFSFDTALVEVSGGLIRLKDLGGATYSTANPAVNTQHQIQASAISSFSDSKSVAGSDQVKYQFIINGTAYWFSTTWQASDGTYSQANTAAEISSALATLLSDLSITQPFYLRLRVFLHSASGATRPTLTTTTIGYTMVYQAAGTISECLIYSYLSDLLGDAYTYDATKPVVFTVSADHGFFHGTKFIRPFAKSATFDANGYMSLSIIETATPGEELQFTLSFYEGNSKKSVKLFNAMVPNASTRAISEITSARAFDAG